MYYYFDKVSNDVYEKTPDEFVKTMIKCLISLMEYKHAKKISLTLNYINYTLVANDDGEVVDDFVGGFKFIDSDFEASLKHVLSKLTRDTKIKQDYMRYEFIVSNKPLAKIKEMYHIC